MELTTQEKFPGLFPEKPRRALLEAPPALSDEADELRRRNLAKLKEKFPGLFAL